MASSSATTADNNIREQATPLTEAIFGEIENQLLLYKTSLEDDTIRELATTLTEEVFAEPNNPQVLSENVTFVEDDTIRSKSSDSNASAQSQQKNEMVPVPLQDPLLLINNRRTAKRLPTDDVTKSSNYKRFCSVPMCNNNRRMQGITIFRIPLARRNIWLQKIGRSELIETHYNNINVCSDHFNKQDMLTVGKRKILKANTDPSLRLPVTAPSENTSDSNQIIILDDEEENEKIIEINNDPLQNLNKLQSKMTTYSNVDSKLPSFVKTSLFKLHFCNQHLYKFLEKSLNLTPIKNIMQNSVPVTTEISEELMMILKIKVENMTEAAKICSVIVETISLKESIAYDIKQDKIIGFHEIDGVQKLVTATNVVVVMVQGIYENWKQLVGFALLSDENCQEISDFYCKLLKNLMLIGLNIRTFAPANLNFFDTIEDAADRPYFFIQNKKVYFMLDVKYLMKLTRNKLMLYDFHFQGMFAKMEHILSYFQYEKSKPGFVPKKEIQIYDTDIASGISTYLQCNKIPRSGEGTVKFITIMNKLYNALNLRNKHKCIKAFQGKETVIHYLEEMLNLFKSLNLIDSENGKNIETDMEFIKGFQITINAILLLIKDLKLEGYKYLPTKRLSKDTLQYFVSQMQRKRTGLDKESDTRFFYLTYNECLLSYLIKPVKRKNNSDDFNKIVIQLISMLDKYKLPIGKNSDPIQNNSGTVLNSSLISSSTYKDLDAPEMHSGYYIASFLYAKCIDYHRNCHDLQLHIHNMTETRFHKYMEYIMDNHGLKDLPVVPPDNFVSLVEKMELVFHLVFDVPINKKILATIYGEIESEGYKWPCQCFPVGYLKILFIRMRIYQTVKVNNMLLRTRRREMFYEEMEQDKKPDD